MTNPKATSLLSDEFKKFGLEFLGGDSTISKVCFNRGTHISPRANFS
jgi:hypothetical protein